MQNSGFNVTFEELCLNITKQVANLKLAKNCCEKLEGTTYTTH